MDKEPNDNERSLLGPLISLVALVVVLAVAYLLYDALGEHMSFESQKGTPVERGLPDTTEDLFVDSIHVSTGLALGPGFDAVRRNCTGCHSAKLITQNRATREGWHQIIRWMQETQGLWDLGRDEARILDYLAEHYAPEAVGRRANLDVKEIEWYVLELK